MPIRIKDNQKLIDIWKVVAWLDAWRWCSENNYNFINFFRNNLTNSEKILTHWLCYITDRQMPFEIVWEKGGYVFSELVHTYSCANCSAQEVLNKHYEAYYDNKGRQRYRFKSNDNRLFASRYVTDDYQSILQTLMVLEKYQKNLLCYIVNVMERFQGREDILIRVACALHLLTYQLDRKKANSQRIITILESDKQFEHQLTKFKNNSTANKKRLWCCIRDYKKGLYHRIFKEAIREISADNAESLIDIWDNLPMDQIELPGDVWNNSLVFRNNLIGSVAEINGIPQNWEMSEIIRRLYEQVKVDEQSIGFYPEQFDITFDFVPRMCSKKLCNACPFGEKGVGSICMSDSNKYCPVALVACGYFAECVGQRKDCLIREGVGKGICKGRVL